MSFVGNQGTFTRGYKAVVMDMLFIYHLGYAIVCVLGLFVHEFFYSFLVRNLPSVSELCFHKSCLTGQYRSASLSLSLSPVVRPGDQRGDLAQRDQECHQERPLYHSHRRPGHLSGLLLLHHWFPLPQGRLSHGGGPTSSTRSEQKGTFPCCFNRRRDFLCFNNLLRSVFCRRV